MDVLADLGDINWLAVVVAAVVGFGLGAVWYAPPVFGRTWMRLVGVSEDDPGGNIAVIMGLAFVTTLIGVSALALFVGADAGAGAGTAAGLVAGVGIASMAVVLNALYESRSPALMAINAGYLIVLFAVAGAILGAW